MALATKATNQRAESRLGGSLGHRLGPSMRRVPRGAAAANDGDPSGETTERELYDQLHRIAKRQRRRWSGNDTLDTTSLLHETLAKLIERSGRKLCDLDHLLAVAAVSMRHVLVDYAKAQKRRKRGGDFQRVEWAEHHGRTNRGPDDMIAMAERLKRLSEIDERRARVFELRFFFGCSVDETGSLLSISPATVKRDWTLATAFLRADFE